MPQPEVLDSPTRGPAYRGADPERLHRLLNDVFTPHEQEIVGRAPLDASVRVLQGNVMRVVDLRYGTDVVIRPRVPPDYYAIRLGHLGRAALNIDGSDRRFSPSIVSPGQVVTARWEGEVHARLLIVPRGPVEDAVRAATGEELTVPVRFAPQLDGQHGQQVLGLLRLYASMLESGPLTDSPLAVAHFETSLIHTLLAAQESTVSEAYKGGGSAGPSTLRRAVAYCQEHARRPVAVAEIASAARVSVRTLQELFRKHLGTTPAGYLRTARLAGAHDDLTAVAQGNLDMTVSQIADRWGFANRGRFGSQYRQVYGRNPSDTLRGRTQPSGGHGTDSG